MWHWIFIAFFTFSIYRLITYQRHWTIKDTYDYQRRGYTSMRRASGNDLTEIAGRIVGETEKAWRL